MKTQVRVEKDKYGAFIQLRGCVYRAEPPKEDSKLIDDRNQEAARKSSEMKPGILVLAGEGTRFVSLCQKEAPAVRATWFNHGEFIVGERHVRSDECYKGSIEFIERVPDETPKPTKEQVEALLGIPLVKYERTEKPIWEEHGLFTAAEKENFLLDNFYELEEVFTNQGLYDNEDILLAYEVNGETEQRRIIVAFTNHCRIPPSVLCQFCDLGGFMGVFPVTSNTIKAMFKLTAE